MRGAQGPSASPPPPTSAPIATPQGAGVEGGRKGGRSEPQARNSQEHIVLKRDVCERPVHQDHLCVLNLFPKLQQQEHSPAVQV